MLQKTFQHLISENTNDDVKSKMHYQDRTSCGIRVMETNILERIIFYELGYYLQISCKYLYAYNALSYIQLFIPLCYAFALKLFSMTKHFQLSST